MYDDVKTGDIILSVWQNFLGYIIRFATHCEYHHTVVAVRIDESYLPKIKVLSSGGKLCVIENKIKATTHNNKKYKCILRELPIPKDKKYKYIYRSLNERYKDNNLLQNTKDYINSNIIEYLDNDGKTIKITKVIGAKKNDIPHNNRGNILNGVCSEISYSYYCHCLGSNVVPSNHYIYSPKNFRHGYMDHIFGDEKMLIDNGDGIFDSTQWWIYLLVLLIIILIILLIIYYNKK